MSLNKGIGCGNILNVIQMDCQTLGVKVIQTDIKMYGLPTLEGVGLYIVECKLAMLIF